MPQTVERIAASQRIDVGLALAGGEQRRIPDASGRDFQNLVNQVTHLALWIPLDDQAPTGTLLRLVEQEMDTVLFQVGTAQAQDVATAKPGHELEADVGIGYHRAPVAGRQPQHRFDLPVLDQAVPWPVALEPHLAQDRVAVDHAPFHGLGEQMAQALHVVPGRGPAMISGNEVGVLVGVHRLHLNGMHGGKHRAQSADGEAIALLGLVGLGGDHFQQIAVHQFADRRDVLELLQAVGPYPVGFGQGLAERELFLAVPLAFHAGRHQVAVGTVLVAPALREFAVSAVAGFGHQGSRLLKSG